MLMKIREMLTGEPIRREARTVAGRKQIRLVVSDFVRHGGEAPR
jgi:hypothetical protein